MPARERHIAGFVDRLPDGAAMDVKSLAKQLPLYGQMAVSSALKALGVAGHLRRVRCLVGEGDQSPLGLPDVLVAYGPRQRVVGRPSPGRRAAATPPRAAPAPAARRPPAAPVPDGRRAPARRPQPSPRRHRPRARRPPHRARAAHPGDAGPADAPSPAYLALARLGRIDTRLALSAADCAALEPLAAEWLARGVDTDYLTQALTAGLPAQVDSPVGLVRRRLTDKLPPPARPAPAPPAPAAPVRRVLLECTDAARPGRPKPSPTASAAPAAPPRQEASAAPPAERDVHALVGQLRDLTRLP